MSIVTILAGRFTGDPEGKNTKNGNLMASFSLADNHGKDDNGNEKTTFFRCTAYGKQAEMILDSCKKGHRLNVVGRLESRQYTNNSGQPATSLDVTVSEFGFIEPREQNQAAPAQQQPQQGYAPQPQQQLPPQQGFPPQQAYPQQPPAGYPPQGYPQQPMPQGYPTQPGYPQQQPYPQQQTMPGMPPAGTGRSPF